MTQQQSQDEKLRARRVADFYYANGKDPTTELLEAEVTLVSEQEFQADSATDNCLFCRTKFTLINRRHHCRRCGFVLCNDCCPKTAETRLCLVCNYAIASSQGIDQTAEDFLTMPQVQTYIRTAQFEPVIIGEIFRVLTNLLQNDTSRARLQEEPLSSIFKIAYQYLQDIFSGKTTFTNSIIKNAQIKNALGVFINLTASDLKYYKQTVGLDFRFLSKALVEIESVDIQQSILWLFVNLSQNEKFAPLFIRYKETYTNINNLIQTDDHKVYMRVLNLAVNLLNFDESCAEKLLTKELSKSMVRNIQQNDPLVCYTSMRAFSSFITHEASMQFLYQTKKFNIFDFVEQLLSKTKSQLGLLSIYVFYTNFIKFAPPEEVQKIVKREILQVVFNPEHKFDEQSKNLKLLFKMNADFLITYLKDNVKVIKFLCKNYKDKDIQGCLKYINDDDVKLLFKQQQDQVCNEVDDDEEVKKTKKKSKKQDSDDEDNTPVKKKSKKVIDDDEEDEDIPKPKKKAKKEVSEESDEVEEKPKKKSKKVVESDEEEDEDNDMPKLKKSKKAKKEESDE